MCMMGRGIQNPKPLTKEEMKEMTDNQFTNPDSGTEVPSWKLKDDKKLTKNTPNKNKLTTSDTYQG